jgi:hypothetical protein
VSAAEGYRFSAEFREELERAVQERLRLRQECALLAEAGRYAHALAVAFEEPAGHPTDPSSDRGSG